VPKRRVGRYPKVLRRTVVERFRTCKNISALSRELGLHRRLLYKWRDQFDSVECEAPLEATSGNSTLRVELNRVKRLLAEKTLELDFFKGALQKVGARRL
jgi:transposase-like protein